MELWQIPKVQKYTMGKWKVQHSVRNMEGEIRKDAYLQLFLHKTVEAEAPIPRFLCPDASCVHIAGVSVFSPSSISHPG